MDRSIAIALGVAGGGVVVGASIVVAAMVARTTPVADAPSLPSTSEAPPATPTTPPVPPPPPPADFMSMSEYQYDKANAETFCRDQWTKRGELNGQMFGFCLGQERDGYRDIPTTLKKFGKYPWMDTLFPAIWEKWTKRGVTQYRMVGYDLKKECDKFLDYQYERKQPSYDSAKLASCLEQWADNTARWSMTMYCYKK